MSLQSLLQNPTSLRIALLVLVAVLLLAAYLWRRRRQVASRPWLSPKERDLPLSTGSSEASVDPGILQETAPPKLEPESAAVDWNQVLEDRPSFGARVARGALILLAVTVGLGFVLVLLPGGTIQSLVGALQASKAADLPPEKIALLYLGDEIKGKDFQIRGIVRNISYDPLENLDATVRLYSPENVLLETVVVRMDRDSILPDAIADFRLVYPNYAGQFGSYSVDFKLRHGELVLYKDRRGTRHLD